MPTIEPDKIIRGFTEREILAVIEFADQASARVQRGRTHQGASLRRRCKSRRRRAGPTAPFRPEGQHWVVDALFSPKEDLQLAMDRALENLGDLDQVDNPWEALDLLGPQNPHFPQWLPKSYQGRELTFPDERRAWFDELMRHYGAYSNDSQLPDDPSSRQRLAVRSLLLMYQGWIMGTLPAPRSIQDKPL